jgi:hypothetical protein
MLSQVSIQANALATISYDRKRFDRRGKSLFPAMQITLASLEN